MMVEKIFFWLLLKVVNNAVGNKKWILFIQVIIGVFYGYSQEVKNDTIEIEKLELIGHKKLIERKADKLVFNIDNKIANSGENTINILKYIPNVRINDNKLNILGKEKAEIMVDGVKLNMSGDNLINYIKSIDPKDIKNIEVLMIPSSKYDAEGNVGIINIKMKSKKEDFWNLIYQNSNNFGHYHNNTNNISVNIQKNRVALSLSVGYKSGLSQYINNNKYLYGDNEEWNNKMISKNDNINFFNRIGLEYKVNNNLNIGLVYNYSLENNNYTDDNKTNIEGNADYFSIDSPAKRFSRKDLHTINVYGLYKDDEEKKTSLDINYIGFNSDNNNLSSTTFYPSRDVSLINSNGKQKINNFTMVIDREGYLGGINLNYGGKISYSDIQNGNNSLQNFSIFRYKEIINAIYIALNKSIGKWDFKAGIRMENTSYKGEQLTTNEINKKEYLEWFPTLYLNYKINKQNNLNISYGRRIKRPGFSLLNPFKWYITPLEYTAGNAQLQPYFIDNIELGYTYKNWNLTPYFSYIRNGFYEVTISDENTRNHMTIPYNSFNSRVLGIKSDYSIDTKWWMSFNEISLYHEDNKAELSLFTNRNVKGVNFSFFTENIFYIDKTMSFNVDWWYTSKGVSSLEYQSSANGLDISMKKTLLGGNLVLGLYGIDILGKNKPRYTSYTNNVRQEYSFYGDGTRYYMFSITYKMGKRKERTGSHKSTNEEEKQRIK